MYKNKPDSQTGENYEEKVIQVSRVSKKTKGGNKIGFSVLVVVGDKKGQVGVALGKATDVLSAMKKGIKKAKKKFIKVPMDGTTIPFSIQCKRGAGVVLLKPAPKGSGVIAGGPVRAVVEAAGIRDISSKILGSENKASSVYATFEALRQIARIVEIKGIKLRSIADVEAEEEKKRALLQEKAKHHHKKSPEGGSRKRREQDKKPTKKSGQPQRKGKKPNTNQKPAGKVVKPKPKPDKISEETKTGKPKK